MNKRIVIVLLGVVGLFHLSPIYSEEATGEAVQSKENSRQAQQPRPNPEPYMPKKVASEEEVNAIRQELDQLRNVSIQVIKRIQYLETLLPQTAQPDPQSQPPAQVAQASQGQAPQQGASGQSSRSQQQGELVRKEPVASRGVDDLVVEQHTLFDQTFSLELGFELSHFSRRQLVLNGFLALDAIFLGNISIDEVESDTFTTSITGRWGVTDRLQLNVHMPWLYRETTTRSGGQDLAATVTTEEEVDDSDIGDISFGLSYQLFPETLTRPDIVWNFSATAPTGKDPYGIDFIEHPLNTNLFIPEELPTGTGLWALSTGLSFLKTTDPAILFANFSYTHYIPEDFSDISSDPRSGDTPGEVRLGDQFQFSLGMAFALNERTSYSMSFTQRFIEEAEIQVDGFSSQKIIGSEATSGTFNIGLTYGLTERLSIVTDLGIGLTNDASDYRFAVKFPYRF